MLEPGAEIEGRLLAKDGSVVTEGTLLAQLDAERYQTAVEAAQAQVDIAKRQQEAIQINIDTGIPASIDSARSELKLAQIEFDRNKRLARTNSASRAEYDKASATLATAKAGLAELQASLKSRQAELESAVAQVRQAEQSLKDAQIDLGLCSLYSFFRGQVADVHVVPGSLVSQGDPALTVQLMDPVKIEVEFSAEQSRRLQRGGRLPVVVTMPDGQPQRLDAYIYLIDPSADATTPTFTVTLLMLNRKILQPTPREWVGKPVARAKDHCFSGFARR